MRTSQDFKICFYRWSLTSKQLGKQEKIGKRKKRQDLPERGPTLLQPSIMKCLQVKLNQVLDVVQKMKENSCETKRSVF